MMIIAVPARSVFVTLGILAAGAGLSSAALGQPTYPGATARADRQLLPVPPYPFVPSSPNALPQLVPTTGSQRAALFVCVADHCVPMTRGVKDVEVDILDPASSSSFANYIIEQSYGQLELLGDVFGLYDVGSAMYSNDVRAAVAAQASGSDVPDWSIYERVFIVLPSADTSQPGVNVSYLNTVNFGNPWNPVSYADMPGFLGTITLTNFGEQPLAVQNFTVQPSTKIGWFIHEFGHALGLGHDRALDCAPAWYDELNYTKTTAGFGMMPIGNNRHATMLEKEYMRWLDDDQVRTVDTNGAYLIQLRAVSQAKAPGDIQLLRVLRAVCTNPSDVDDACGGDQFGYYYVEYRRPKGFDAALFDTPWTPTGAVTSMAGPLIYVNAFRDIGNTLPHTGAKLNMTPLSPPTHDWHYTDMDLGVIYVDPKFGTTLRLLAADDDEALIEVIATGL